MANKKLLPVSANNPPIPPPPVPVIPGVPTTTTTTVPPSQPKPSQPTTGKLVPSNKKSTKTRYGTVQYEQLPGDIPTRIKTEGKAIGSMVLNAPVGAANFFVGGAIDIGKAGIDVAAALFGADYDPGEYKTSQEFNQSLGRTKDFIGKLLQAGATVSSTVGTITPSGVGRAIEKEAPTFPDHYMAALNANQSILPFLVEDFGNISMAGSLYSGLAKAGVRGVTLGEAATQAERAAAAQLLDEAIPGTAEAAAAAERLAKAEAKVQRVANAKAFLTEQMNLGKQIEKYANKVGALPFKPYAYGTRKILSLYRDGIYLGENGRYARWGAKAARGYAEQAAKLVDEGVSPDDERVVNLINKSVKAGRRATSREVMKQVREAGRDAENESGSAVRAVIDQIKEPLHKDVINPATGEAYGELSPDEVAAVLAIQGGNAQIINRIANRYKVPPKILALLGRYDFYQEYSLSERAAQLASDFLDFDPNAPGRMTIEQYERLSNAAENVAQTVFKSMIERAAQGYGRRNPLPPEQLVPTPFVDRLERNIIESIKQAERALKKERAKKTVDRAEVMRLQQILNDRIAVFESWQQIKETGVLELPVDHPDRIAVLKGFVDQLPMELALDPSMYSAAMRVPLEFYRRLRRGMAASILDDGGPEIVPEDGGGPRLTPPRSTKEGAVEAELSKRQRKVKAIEKKIDNVAEKIDKKEAQHAKLVERIVRYDIVDAYIAGSTPEQIARDFSLDLAMVEGVLKSSQSARTYRRSVELKAKADEARSRLTPEEINAMPEMMAEAERLDAEASAAQAEYQNILRLAEEERRQIESEADRLNEELYDLEEEMGDYEDAYERAGGVVDDLWDPESSSPFKQLGPTDEGLRKTDAASFEKDFNSFEQLVAPQEGWKRGDVELYRPSDIPGKDEINARFLPYVKSERYADSYYLYSFYNNNPNSIILAIDVSPKQFVPHHERIFIAVPETWQEFVEVLKKEIDFEATGKYTTAQNKLKKVLQIAEDQVSKGKKKIYSRDNAAAAIPNDKQLKLVENNINQYNRVRDGLILDKKSLDEAVAKNSQDAIERYTEDIKSGQESLERYKNKIKDLYPFIDVEKLLEGDSFNTEDFATPQSVIDKQLEKFGDTLPETLPKGAVGNGGVTSRTGGLIKTYTSETSQVDVNVAATYIGFEEPKPNTKGLLFTAKDKNLDLDVFEVYISGNYQENKFAAAIDLFTEMRDVLESGEVQDYDPSGFPGAEIELINPDLLTLEQIDLMIDAINDAATGGLDTQQVETAPSLKPVPAVPEPAAAEFTSEDAKNLVAKIVHTDMGIEGVDIDNLAYKHWRTEPFELDSKKTATRQVKYVKDAIKSGRPFQLYLEPKTKTLYWTDSYVLVVLSKEAINYVMSLGAKTDGLYNYKGPQNKNPDTVEKILDDPDGIKMLLKQYKFDKNQQPAEFLYRKRTSGGADLLVFKDPKTGGVLALDENKLGIFNPQKKVYLSFNEQGKGLPAYVVDAGETNMVMPYRMDNLSETPPTMVERMRNFAVELRASKISPKKTNYRSVSSIADAIEAALPEEAPAEVAVPEKPALAQPPAPKPKPLRPKATKPSEVKPDTVIKDPVVREAVYTTEVVDSMAAEAAAKMDAAQTAKEKLKAFQEWLDASKKYDAEIARLAIELDPSRNARAEKEKIEKKIAELREIAGELPETLEAAEASVERLVSNPLYPVYMGMDKMLPLDVALSGNFPADIGGFELPVGPDGEGVRLMGPMYYPSGVPQKFYGGIEREVTQSGFRGYQRLASEHYRDGDRHVIFSLRQVALRMQREIRQMVMNERFRAIVASIGSTASEILGEDFTQSLYEQAVLWADSMPQDSLYVRFRAMMAQSLGEDAPVSGIASPGPGVRSQARVRQWAIDFRYGELIGDAMRARGYEAINPFADIERAIAAQNIKAKRTGEAVNTPEDAISPTPDEVTQETMFLPKGVKEKMLEVIVPKDSGVIAKVLKGSQKVTSFFKVGTLVFSIPWQLGDLISGMIISTMSGVDPRTLIHYMKQVAVEEYGTGRAGLKRMVLPNADYTEFRRGPFARLAGESGVQNLGASMQERAYLYGEELVPERGVLDRISGGRLRFISEAAKKVTGVSFKINETINKITRHAFFLEKLDGILRERGQTLESIRNVENWQNDAELKQAVFEAARSANEWLGDYANLSVKERKYLQPVFPFWAWMRHIHHVFDMLAVENPESLFYYMYLGTLASEDDDPLNLRKGGFSIFGGVASSNWLNPFADVFNGPIGAALLEQDLRPLGSSFGPVPRLVGGVVGLDISRFGALRRPSGTGGYSESGEKTSGSILPLIGGSVSETIGFTAQQFPMVQRLLNLNPTPFENIPGTRVALGPVARYQTGEARLSPRTGQRIVQPGGRLASTLRMFGGPLVPYRSDEQINDVLMAARQKLLTLDELQRMRELQGAP